MQFDENQMFLFQNQPAWSFSFVDMAVCSFAGNANWRQLRGWIKIPASCIQPFGGRDVGCFSCFINPFFVFKCYQPRMHPIQLFFPLQNQQAHWYGLNTLMLILCLPAGTVICLGLPSNAFPSSFYIVFTFCINVYLSLVQAHQILYENPSTHNGYLFSRTPGKKCRVRYGGLHFINSTISKSPGYHIMLLQKSIR